METPPLHVLLALDAQILGGEVYDNTSPTPSVTAGEDISTSGTTGHDGDDDEDWSPESPALGDEGDGSALTTTSRFWGVCWNRVDKKWQAYYKDADGKMRTISLFGDEEEAARAVNKAIRDAGLESKRRVNLVDATGALVPRERTHTRRPCDRSAVVAPDPSRPPSTTTSKYWGVTWSKQQRRWMAQYRDADDKQRTIGYFDTQEAAAHAVNAAIRRAGLGSRRHTNPVVDGQLVPKPPGAHNRKRRRDEPAAAPSPRAQARRAVNYEDSEPDDEDLALAPPDDEDGWD